MDSERSHETPKNDLETLLYVKGPEFFRKHFANVLLGLILVASIGYFFWQRSNARAAERHQTNLYTSIAYDDARRLRELTAFPDTTDSAARNRQALFLTALANADAVLNSDAEVSQKATAQLAKAEALWAMATASPTSLSSTQPVTGYVVRTPTAYLEDARAAYYEILQRYPEQKEVAANALLSLATISESTAKFDEAADWYNKVINDASLRSIYHEIAKSRLVTLTDLRRPYFLSAPTRQPTASAPVANEPAPASQPASIAPSDLPPTLAAPATDATPATVPTTQP